MADYICGTCGKNVEEENVMVAVVDGKLVYSHNGQSACYFGFDPIKRRRFTPVPLSILETMPDAEKIYRFKQGQL